MESVRDLSRHFTKEKRTLKFVRPDQLHLTLKFLGNDVSQASIEAVIDTLERHRNMLNKPEIILRGVEFGFKGQIRAKVLSIFAEPTPDLNNLAININELVRDLELRDVAPKKERKKFLHHLTIARAKDTVNRNFKKKVDAVLEQAKFQKITFSPEYISIMQSELTNIGPKYKELARITLTKKAD